MNPSAAGGVGVSPEKKLLKLRSHKYIQNAFLLSGALYYWAGAGDTSQVARNP